MKRLCIIVAAAVLSCAGARANPDDYVQPQTLSGIALYRDVTGIAYSTNIHFVQGASLLMTNMVCYSTANLGTNRVIQGLDEVRGEVATSVSSTTTGTWHTAAVQVASNGTWHLTLDAIPTASTVYWQCRLTDSVTNTYYYQQQILYADPHL
jgi:FtsP/CotA-like multicopper oxidase with cupredoxin domain